MSFTTKEYEKMGFTEALAKGNSKERLKKTSQLATYINNRREKPIFDRYVNEAIKNWTGKEYQFADNHNRIRSSISIHVRRYFSSKELDYDNIRNLDRLALKRSAAIERERNKRARSGSSSVTVPPVASSSVRLPTPIIQSPRQLTSKEKAAAAARAVRLERRRLKRRRLERLQSASRSGPSSVVVPPITSLASNSQRRSTIPQNALDSILMQGPSLIPPTPQIPQNALDGILMQGPSLIPKSTSTRNSAQTSSSRVRRMA